MWKPAALASPEYQAMLRAMHERPDKPWNGKGKRQIKHFLKFFHNLGCVDILDYGSGVESLRILCETYDPPIPVACYDPGVPAREALPAPADFVVCTDVLEHIEPHLLRGVIAHIHHLTNKGAFLSIALIPSPHTLTDGRNAHISLLPAQTWLSMLRLRGWHVVDHNAGSKFLQVWLKK